MRLLGAPEGTTLLEGYAVKIELPILWGDMDAFLHVNNVAYFRHCENARIEYMTRVGLDTTSSAKIGATIASADCKFKVPLTFPDTVTVGARVLSASEHRFSMEYIIVSHRLCRIAAVGCAELVAYDFVNMKKIPIPVEARSRIAEIERWESRATS